jgi:hypothetical protein
MNFNKVDGQVDLTGQVVIVTGVGRGIKLAIETATL